MTSPRLGVVLVNWNRWADTIECLESLFRSSVPLHVVVVDNASADGSLERIAAWARGDEVATATDPMMARFSQPPVAKPIAFTTAKGADPASPPEALTELTLIDSGGNLGFAGGNNVGLRHLMRRTKLDYFWLLNNDTVVEAGTAAALLATLDATHNAGMCGTVVRYYHRPDFVQALNGARFSPWSGQSTNIGGGQLAAAGFDPLQVARQTDMVLGASLAVTRAFLSVVGLMEDRYFLYFEEIDWAVRSNGRFAIAFAHGATVYHKEGGSIGSSGQSGQRSGMSEYYLLRSRLIFIRRYHPWLMPLHLGLGLTQVGRRLVRGQPGKAWAMMRAIVGMAY